jgi:hypothetical protein
MNTAIAQLQSKAAIWIEQMAGVIAFADKLGQPRPSLEAYQNKITQLYNEELELARLFDDSDLIVHANGTAIQNHRAALGAVTSLFANVEKQVKRLAQSVLHLGVADAKKAMSMLDIRLTGIAPGSIYAGFLIEPPSPSKLLGTDEQNAMMLNIKAATLSITNVPQCVTENGHISEELAEFVTDPAVRDSAILAAYHLSPSGRGGISSIDLINPANQSAKITSLGASHRALLREITQKNPLIQSRSKEGTFVGLLTRIDLDKSRVDLRDIGAEGFNSIRCILPALTVAKGREMLGQRVMVRGRYETTPTGRPSLMHINECKVVEQLEFK